MQEIDRKAWLSILAKAPAAEVAKHFTALDGQTDYTQLRAPEIGAVMMRGRMGGTGDAFNLGEMTVTRCSIELASGEIGHGYVQGRNRVKAEQVAVLDALLQTRHADALLRDIVVPLQQSMATTQDTNAKKAAATKVDFFTLVRGED